MAVIFVPTIEIRVVSEVENDQAPDELEVGVGIDVGGLPSVTEIFAKAPSVGFGTTVSTA